MYAHGFVKIAAASLKTKTGDAHANVLEIIQVLTDIEAKKASFAVFPELCICGYSIGDLIFQEYLYRDNLEAIQYLLDHNPFSGVVMIGTYLIVDDLIYNCCIVIQKNVIIGVVPKYNLPHSYEFYESRWFAPGSDAKFDSIRLMGKTYPFGKMIFSNEDLQVTFAVEICEDMWAPMSPNEKLYANGAMIVFNLSASPDYITKNQKRLMIAQSTSYKCNGAYIYVSNNASESTSEVVFSNHKMIIENGDIIKNDDTITLDNHIIYGDIDIARLHYLRRHNSWLKNIRGEKEVIRKIAYSLLETNDFSFEDPIDLKPLMPKNAEECKRIIDMQAVGMKKRLDYIGIDKTIIGVSGGLDSTLALLSLCHMCDTYGMNRQSIIAITMPSKHTNKQSLDNARKLMQILGVTAREVHIDQTVVEQLKTIGHDGKTTDITYENVQARYRTSILMNTANLESGLVVGTSDMSEVALGWSTFNGDQMAMYGMNSGLTKSVVREVVRFYHTIYPELKDVLDSICNQPISPELSGIEQKTEQIIGKYEINDFILYRFLVNGDNEQRIVYLLNTHAGLSLDEAKKYVNNFYKRFYSQQYKRLTMPEGVKILNLSLSPRTETRLTGDLYKPVK